MLLVSIVVPGFYLTPVGVGEHPGWRRFRATMVARCGQVASWKVEESLWNEVPV